MDFPGKTEVEETDVITKQPFQLLVSIPTLEQLVLVLSVRGRSRGYPYSRATAHRRGGEVRALHSCRLHGKETNRHHQTPAGSHVGTGNESFTHVQATQQRRERRGRRTGAHSRHY